MWFKEREQLLFASYDDSRMESWSDQFRSNFVQSCSSTVSPNLGVDPGQFCYCVSSSVEGAHILSTKFNPNVTSSEELALKNLLAFQNYMNSEPGRYAAESCTRKISGVTE